MSIRIDECADRQTILVRTRFSEYELTVLRGDGDVLMRGGRHFTEFQRAVFLGSAAAAGSFQSLTIDVGLCMRFVVADRLFVTSPVESLSPIPGRAATQDLPDRSTNHPSVSVGV